MLVQTQHGKRATWFARVSIFLLLCTALSAQQTIDHSTATRTTPFQTGALEPGSCSIGMYFWNTTTQIVRRCLAANTWADAAIPSFTFATLPTGVGAGFLAVATDGCAGGASAALCRWSGSAWAVLSGSVKGFCTIENDTQSATALTDAQITGRCDVLAASTLIEVAVYANAGTPTVLLERWRPNGGTTADLMSGTLVTGASGAFACAATAAACLSGVAKSGITLSNTALLAGDVIRVKSATAGGVAVWHHIVAIYSVP